MPDVYLTRLIGIASMIALFIAVGVFAANISNQVNLDTTKSSLQEVTEKVSSELIDLVSLASLNPTSTFTYKILDIPDNINSKGYSVNLTEDYLGWKVVAYLDQYNTVRAESNLYFRNGINVMTGIISPYDVTYNWQNATLFCGTSVYSGSTSTSLPVVWCQINSTNIIVGLGRLVAG